MTAAHRDALAVTDCPCDSCKIACLAPEDRDWLRAHGWKPTPFDEACKIDVQRLIGEITR